ncbi:hypothetical protein C8F01DRAFT_1083445 [Mycena amicta]|nr:hypothetical protein C8F01DRAFT_1083445 [Mycena amicta]
MCIINCVPKIFLQSAHSALPLPTPYFQFKLRVRANYIHVRKTPPKKYDTSSPTPYAILPVPFKLALTVLRRFSNSAIAATGSELIHVAATVGGVHVRLYYIHTLAYVCPVEASMIILDKIHIRRGVPPVHGPPAHWQARVMFLKPQAKNTGISDFPAQLPLARNSNSTQASTDVLYQLMNAVVGNRESGRMRMHTPTNTFSSLASLLAQARAESRVTVPPVSLPVARKIQILEPAKC